MIGILVVTHGDLGKALLSTASMLIEDNIMIAAVGFFPGQGAEDLEKEISKILNDMKECEGILCFVDIIGGTPSRVLGEFITKDDKLKLVTGVNLPILLEAILSRNDMKLSELVLHVIERGKESILDLGWVLNSSKSS